MRKVTTVNYELKLSDRGNNNRVYHINILKRWHVLPTPATEVAMLAIPPIECKESQEGIEELCETEEDVP